MTPNDIRGMGHTNNLLFTSLATSKIMHKTTSPKNRRRIAPTLAQLSSPRRNKPRGMCWKLYKWRLQCGFFSGGQIILDKEQTVPKRIAGELGQSSPQSIHPTDLLLMAIFRKRELEC